MPAAKAGASGSRLRRAALNGLTAALSLALCLAVLEAATRWIQPQAGTYTGRGLYQPDFDLGHVLRPHLDTGGVRTSSLGFRDREYPLAKPPGAFRILGLGDSFTFGGPSADEIYLEVLERLFAASGLPFPVEVINAGVPSYNTHQEAGLFDKFGARLGPDLVILGLFVTGDVIENADDEHLHVVDGELTGRAVGRWERLLLRSHLYRFLRSRSRVHAMGDGIGADAFLAVELDRLEACKRKPPGHVRRGFQATEQALVRLRDRVMANGATLLVLLIPDEIQVSPSVLAQVMARFGRSAADYDLDLPNRRLSEVLDRAGIPRLDVLEVFRREHALKPVYRPQDTHWNAAGAALAARLLYEHLQSDISRLRSIR